MGKLLSTHLDAKKVNDVLSSCPINGVTVNTPDVGGPLTDTEIDALDSMPLPSV